MTTSLATLAQVKEYIGNSADNSDDALLTRLIGACSGIIERTCNRTFGTATYTDTHNGNGGQFMVFENRPITAVASVTVDDVAIPQSTSATMAGWVLSEVWKLSLRGHYRFTQGVQNVTVTYTAGYTTIPEDLVQSCCLLVGLAYKERDRMGLDSKSINGESISFTNDDFPPSVKQTIQNYRNVFMP